MTMTGGGHRSPLFLIPHLQRRMRLAIMIKQPHKQGALTPGFFLKFH
jgi:hypothetical protein